MTRNKIQSISNQGQSRFGFFMHDGAQVPANGNLFLYNQIFGASGNNTGYDYGCCAVHWESAGPWSVCSNTTDHTYRGFHFMGICGKSFFGKNNINDHNYAPNSEPHSGAGLIIQGLGSNNAFIGDQDCQENYWDPTDYSLPTAYTAVILGAGNNPPGLSTVQKNEFRVADLSDPHQTPIDRNPMTNWFLLGQCLQTPTDCGAQLSTPTIDENDEWVRSNYPQVQTSPGVEEWQTTRYLLAKLLRYPNLAAGNMLAFKNAYSQSSAILFAQFDSLINSISSITAGSQTSLNSLESRIRNKQAQINVLDATISDYSSIPTEFMSSRAALMSELAILSDQKKVLLAQNTSLRVPLLTVCEQFNNSLPGIQVNEQNQKLLNALTIQQARGIELTQYNKNALHEIAQQCIQMAGLTKSAAASMLPPEEGAQYWKENPLDYDCLQKATLNNEEVSDKFIISPNPATDLLHFQMSRPIKGEIEISDLSGRSIHVLKIKEEANVLDIPISQLENGVYLLSYSDTTGKHSASVKFVVLR